MPCIQGDFLGEEVGSYQFHPMMLSWTVFRRVAEDGVITVSVLTRLGGKVIGLEQYEGRENALSLAALLAKAAGGAVVKEFADAE